MEFSLAAEEAYIWMAFNGFVGFVIIGDSPVRMNDNNGKRG